MALAALAPTVHAADLRLSFEAPALATGDAPLRLGVALAPANGQRMPDTPRAKHRLALHGDGFQPTYLTMAVGDRLIIDNQDAVFHQLEAYRFQDHWSRVLGKAGGGHSSVELEMDRAGVWHVFCRLHRHGYARVEVVAARYLFSAEAPGEWELSGLPPGRYRVRVYDGIRPQTLSVEAYTAPTPTRVQVSAGTRTQSRDSHTPLSLTELYPLPGTAAP